MDMPSVLWINNVRWSPLVDTCRAPAQNREWRPSWRWRRPAHPPRTAAPALALPPASWLDDWWLGTRARSYSRPLSSEDGPNEECSLMCVIRWEAVITYIASMSFLHCKHVLCCALLWMRIGVLNFVSVGLSSCKWYACFTITAKSHPRDQRFH